MKWQETLFLEAVKAREKAYAPYSQFLVGAALLTKSGTVYTGCNIENAAYTPSNCAERTAFFKAVSEGEREFLAIAIAAGSKEKALQVTAPCGVCRQVMGEFCDPKQFHIIMGTDKENLTEVALEALFPYQFGVENLEGATHD